MAEMELEVMWKAPGSLLYSATNLYALTLSTVASLSMTQEKEGAALCLNSDIRVECLRFTVLWLILKYLFQAKLCTLHFGPEIDCVTPP